MDPALKTWIIICNPVADVDYINRKDARSEPLPMETGMSERSAVEREIGAQKAVIRSLKREIFGADKTCRSRYIRDFNSEYRGYVRACSRGEVFDEAAACDIVYFGDYHPLEQSQTLALTLMREIAARGASIVLALEMLYEHQQETLDRWMKGSITESEFLEAIDYSSEWGFDWPSFRRIFEAARDPFIPIFGIDNGPRDHLEFIRRRDRMMARRIRSIRSFFPGRLILVIAGESHLASTHLPAEVRELEGGALRETVIVQNIDELYWELMRKGEEAEALLAAPGRYCVFTASPIVKYQSYRSTIDRWAEGEACDTVTPQYAEMIRHIIGTLVDGGPPVVVMGDGWSEDVMSVLPEVRYAATYKSAYAYLRSRGVPQDRILEAGESLRRSGMSYMHGINTLLVLHREPAGAAREAARLVVYAMRGEIGAGRAVRRSRQDRFYASVFEEALCRVGERSVNPDPAARSRGPLTDLLERGLPAGERLPGMTRKETVDLAGLLRHHLRRESEKGGLATATPKLARIYRLGARKRARIVETLGSTLGDAIYDGFHEGSVRAKELASLFGERFDAPGRGPGLYLEWTARTGPDRSFLSPGGRA